MVLSLLVQLRTLCGLVGKRLGMVKPFGYIWYVFSTVSYICVELFNVGVIAPFVCCGEGGCCTAYYSNKIKTFPMIKYADIGHGEGVRGDREAVT